MEVQFRNVFPLAIPNGVQFNLFKLRIRQLFCVIEELYSISSSQGSRGANLNIPPAGNLFSSSQLILTLNIYFLFRFTKRK